MPNQVVFQFFLPATLIQFPVIRLTRMLMIWGVKVLKIYAVLQGHVVLMQKVRRPAAVVLVH